jgi:hypothetical protein
VLGHGEVGVPQRRQRLGSDEPRHRRQRVSWTVVMPGDFRHPGGDRVGFGDLSEGQERGGSPQPRIIVTSSATVRARDAALPGWLGRA